MHTEVGTLGILRPPGRYEAQDGRLHGEGASHARLVSAEP